MNTSTQAPTTSMWHKTAHNFAVSVRTRHHLTFDFYARREDAFGAFMAAGRNPRTHGCGFHVRPGTPCEPEIEGD